MTMDCFPLLQNHTRLIGFQETVYKIKVEYEAESFEDNDVLFSESEAHDEIEQVFRAVLYIDKHGGDLKPILTKYFVIRTKKVPWDFILKYKDYVFTKRGKKFETCQSVYVFNISSRKSIVCVEQNSPETRQTSKQCGQSGSQLTKERHPDSNETRTEQRHSKTILSAGIDSSEDHSRRVKRRSEDDSETEMDTDEGRKEAEITKRIVLRRKRNVVAKRKEQNLVLTAKNDGINAASSSQNNRTNESLPTRIDTETCRKSKRLKNQCLVLSPIYQTETPDKSTTNQSGETTEMFEDTGMGTSQNTDGQNRGKHQRVRSTEMFEETGMGTSHHTDGQNRGKHQRVRGTRSAAKPSEEVDSSQNQDDTMDEFAPEVKKRRSARIQSSASQTPNNDRRSARIQSSASQTPNNDRRSSRIVSADSQTADSDRTGVHLPRKLPTHKPGENADMMSSPRVSTVRPVKRDNSSHPQDSPARRTRSRVTSPSRRVNLARSSRHPRHMGPDEETRRIEMLRQERPTQVYRNVLLARGRDRHTVERAERAETDKLQQLYQPTQTRDDDQPPTEQCDDQPPTGQRSNRRRSSGLWGMVMDKIVTPTRKYFSKSDDH